MYRQLVAYNPEMRQRLQKAGDLKPVAKACHKFMPARGYKGLQLSSTYAFAQKSKLSTHKNRRQNTTFAVSINALLMYVGLHTFFY